MVIDKETRQLIAGIFDEMIAEKLENKKTLQKRFEGLDSALEFRLFALFIVDIDLEINELNKMKDKLCRS